LIVAKWTGDLDEVTLQARLRTPLVTGQQLEAIDVDRDPAEQPSA
jgi:hypothetical protein